MNNPSANRQSNSTDDLVISKCTVLNVLSSLKANSQMKLDLKYIKINCQLRWSLFNRLEDQPDFL